MRAKRFHGLKRLKIRQTWNKYNLYNLSRLQTTNLQRTLFQQKWTAKATARAYHGEQVREKQWQRQFTSRQRAVIPMDHRYLAAFDGSEQARGRGSGREPRVRKRPGKNTLLPYMNMTFSPLERRLDTAIFRALFASSARQARQFVVHGAVKVNGKKMVYPGYLLNPGDMFQVDPERVMFATGAPKDAKERRLGRQIRKKTKEAEGGRVGVAESGEVDELERSESSSMSAEVSEVSEGTNTGESGDTINSKLVTSKVTLENLLAQAKSVLGKNTDAPSAKHKQKLRAFSASVRYTIKQLNKKSVETLDSTVSNLDNELNTVLSQLSISSKYAPVEANNSTSDGAQLISKEDHRALRDALREARENPIDSRKPYATPWRPRPYMSPFAFIPRYLEVNQNICSAVYLRHPVVRPSLAEVPTPFTPDTNQLAFSWYLRRR